MTDVWDWVEMHQGAITALSSVLLAILTAVYVVFSRTALDHSLSAAMSAEQSAATASALLELEFLPVVVARFGSASIDGQKRTRLDIEVVNVGRTAALRPECTILTNRPETYPPLMTKTITPTLEPAGRAHRPVTMGAEHKLCLELEGWSLVCDYEDAVGRHIRRTTNRENESRLVEVKSDGSEREIFAR